MGSRGGSGFLGRGGWDIDRIRSGKRGLFTWVL